MDEYDEDLGPLMQNTNFATIKETFKEKTAFQIAR